MAELDRRPGLHVVFYRLVASLLCFGAAALANTPAASPDRPLRGILLHDSWGSHSTITAAVDSLARSGLIALQYNIAIIGPSWFRFSNSSGDSDAHGVVSPNAVFIDSFGRYYPDISRFPSTLFQTCEHLRAAGVACGARLMSGVPREAVARALPVLGASPYTVADIAATPQVVMGGRQPFNLILNSTHPASLAYVSSQVELLHSYGVTVLQLDCVGDGSSSLDDTMNLVSLYANASTSLGITLSIDGSLVPQLLVPSLRSMGVAMVQHVSAPMWDQWTVDWESLDRFGSLGGDGIWPFAGENIMF